MRAAQLSPNSWRSAVRRDRPLDLPCDFISDLPPDRASNLAVNLDLDNGLFGHTVRASAVAAPLVSYCDSPIATHPHSVIVIR